MFVCWLSGLVRFLCAQVLEGFGEGWEGELETAGEEFAGGDASAFEDQLGFGAQEEGPDLEHPFGGGEADGHTDGVSEEGHHVGVWQRVGCGHIDGPLEIGVVDDPFDGAGKVEMMHPRDELMAGAHAAAEAESGKAREHGEDAIAGMAEDHGGSESHFPCRGSWGCIEGTFPGEDDVDGEGVVDAGGGSEI